MALFDSGSSKEIKKLQEQIAKEPDNIRLYIKLGDIFIKNRNKVEGIKNYRLALNCLVRDDYVKKAIALTKMILKIDPDLEDLKDLLKDLNQKAGYAVEPTEPPKSSMGEITTELRRAALRRQAEALEREAEGRIKRHTILVVDDEDKIISSLKRSLRMESFEVLTATSGSEALSILQKDKVDLILTDNMMPGMSGVELLKQVRILHPKILRIMLTGHAGLSETIKAINEGEVFRFMTKPWDNDELKETLRLALLHKDVRESLRYEREFAEKVVESVEDIVLLLDAGFIIRSFNPFMERVSGYSLEEIKGKNWYELFQPEEPRPENLETFLSETTADGGELEHSSGYLIAQNGERKVINWRYKGLKDEYGGVVGLLCIGQDLSDKKRAGETICFHRKFDAMIMRMMADFVRLTAAEISAGVQKALAEIGDFVGADRCLAAIFNPDGESFEEIMEWCSPGILSKANELKGLPLSRFNWLRAGLDKRQAILITRQSDLPEEAVGLFGMMASHEAISCLIIPIYYKENTYGFICLESVREEFSWSEERNQTFTLLGEFFANAYRRKWLNSGVAR